MRLWLAGICAGVMLAAPVTAGAAERAFVPGEVLVRFAPRLDGAQVRSRLAARDSEVQRSLGAVPGLRLVDAPPGESVGDAVATFERMPGVLYAEPNYRRDLFAVPSDPMFSRQWALLNTGQDVFGTVGLAGADERATGAWERSTGDPAHPIAVVDTGASLNHPDLAANIWTNPGEVPGNGLDDDINGYVDDVHGWDFAGKDADPSDSIDTDEGHGTFAAGVVGAVGNNGIGVAGVNWRASVMPLRVPLTVDGELAAFEYAKDNGARVVNYSAGQSLRSSSEEAAINASPNVLFVIAAGNDTSNNDASPIYPCNYDSPNIICVGSSSQRDGLSGFTNFGPTSVDLVAPGENILSTWPAGGVSQVYEDAFSRKPLKAAWRGGGKGKPWGLTRRIHKGLSAANRIPGGRTAPSDAWIRSRPIDLTSQRACILGYYFKVRTASKRDRLLVQVSKRKQVGFRKLRSYTRHDRGKRFTYVPRRFNGARKFYVRFRFKTAGGGHPEAAYVDNVELSCEATRDTWAYDSGSSFSAPQVAGAAGLVLAAHPGYTTAQLRSALLDSVDRLPALAGKVATGGRLNIAAALGP